MAIKTTVLPDTLQSNGNAFDLSDETFGELRDANSLLGNMAAIHERFAEDGYLLFRNYLDKDKVLAGTPGTDWKARLHRPYRPRQAVYGVYLFRRYERHHCVGS